MRIPRKAALLGACLAFSFVMATSTLANAQDKDKSGSGQPVSVVAHVNVPGSPAAQMRLQQENGHEYLYLLRSSGSGFTVIDVTKPEKALVLKKVTMPPGTSTQGLDMVGNSMAMAEESNGNSSNANSKSVATHPESIQMFDVTNPAHPRAVKTFTGVTSVLTEDGRHLIYLTNNEGLWILRRSTKSAIHPCTSSADISAYPECQ